MGVFKQIKDMKNLGQGIADTPEQTRDNVGELGGQADPDFEPIASVSLELYAEISRSLAGTDHDQVPRVVIERGISADDWAIASAGWNARMKSNPAVGAQFGSLYAAS